MPLNIFRPQQFSWLQDYRSFDFLSPILKNQQRIANYDDATIFVFLKQNGLTYANDFILVLTSDGNLRLAHAEEKFQQNEIVLLINQPNRHNLQNNGTVKQPVNKRQLRGLRNLDQNERLNFNLELNGIYQQLLHVADLFFEKNEVSADHVFNFRIYPTIYHYVLSEYHLPATASFSEEDAQVISSIGDFLGAYLWLNISQITTTPLSQANSLHISQLIEEHKLQAPLGEIDYLQLNSHFFGELS